MMANNENILTVKISRSTLYFVCNVIVISHNLIVQQYKSVVASIYCTLATVTVMLQLCLAKLHTVLQ